MGPSPSRRILLPAMVLLAVQLASCDGISLNRPRSLEQIRQRGRIAMVTQNSANAYYIYRDEPMGFEYDLAREFADYLGVELEVLTPGWLKMFELIGQGKGDFIGAGLTIVPSREARVDFSLPYLSVRQRLITHEDKRGIRNLKDLEGLTIHVREGTSYQERLEELREEGIGLEMVAVPDIPTEELIEKVAAGEIEATVADSNIALMNRRYFPQIRIGIPLSEEQNLAWAVRKGNGDLLAAINEFMEQSRSDGTLGKIRRRYFDDRNVMDKVDLKAFHRRLETRLPRYEPLIREAAEEFGFDWRLIAAVVYQESHLNPYAQSYTGVRGLMQVTRKTAEEMGIDDRLDPAQSVRAGVKYLASLYGRFVDVEDSLNRLLFALASYNVGYGHIRDAQGIALKNDGDPVEWASLREVLPLLRRPEYYLETKYGYARGDEAVRYVSNVLTYYDILIGKRDGEG